MIPLHAVRILTEVDSFVHTPTSVGSSDSIVNGAIPLLVPEPFPGVSESFLVFGDAFNELKLPKTASAGVGTIRTGGYLAVINKVDFSSTGGGVDWSTGSNAGGTTGDKVGVIRGLDARPEIEITDNSITTVTDSSFANPDAFWICGTTEDPDPDGIIHDVEVSGLGANGNGQQTFAWNRFGKSGYLMKWSLASFAPSVMVALEGVSPARNYFPVSVAALADESVLVMCSSDDTNWQLRKYDATGAFEWSWPFPDDTAQGVKLIEGKGSEAGNYFVLARVLNPSLGGFGGRDVVLYCVTPNPSNTGADPVSPWHGTVLGGPNDDVAGAMFSHTDGTLSVAFSVEEGQSMFPVLDPNSYGDLTKEHCVVTSLQRNTASNMVEANWARTAAKAVADAGTSTWRMRASRLSIDALGNLHIGMRGLGLYEIEHVNRTLTGNGSMLSIDGTGRAWDYKDLAGFSRVGGVLGFGVEEQIALGDNGTGLTMSVFRPEQNQDSYVVSVVDPLDGDSAMMELVTTMAMIGGVIHSEIRHDRFDIFAVSVFLTPEQLQEIEGDPTFSVDPDPQVITQNSGGIGMQASTGWALHRLNEPEAVSPGAGSGYDFFLDDGIELEERPWVFLLDTGLPALRVNDLSESRFEPQSPPSPSPVAEMTWKERTLNVFGSATQNGGYAVNVNSDHAEKVTKLMAFKPFGSGQGIPFQLENINIYPNLGSSPAGTPPMTFPSYIADGILLAVDQVLDERVFSAPPFPGALIVIPSSGLSPNALTEYNILELALDFALDANIAIILSAGNNASDPVEMTIPAGYGSRAGIITIGATELEAEGVDNARATAQSSDSSGTITLYAPGVAVPVGLGGETFTGTSASCALAAGAAAATLSRNPNVTPEVLENAMIANGFFQSTDQIQLLTLNTAIPEGCGFEDWLQIHGLSGEGVSDDGDSDGFENVIEYLSGSNPADLISREPLVSCLIQGDEIWTIGLEVPTWMISSEEPFQQLELNCPETPLTIEVVVEWSHDLENWIEDEEDSGWSLGLADLTRRVTPLLFTVPESSDDEKRFWRFILRELP